MKYTSLMRVLVVSLPASMLAVACSNDNGSLYEDQLADTEDDALEALTLLEELRAGRTSNVIELLEMELDSSILTIDARLNRVGDSELDSAVETLHMLKDYRQQHPRQREAVIPDSDSFSDQTVRMMQSASNILRELE